MSTADCIRVLAAGAALLFAFETLPISAQTLNVPLSGKRARHIRPETLFHTLFHDFFPEDDATTYVQTGDIPAMWLRDSSAQTIPYVRFEHAFPILRQRLAGVIERDARSIVRDPYANAVQADYHVWERKWEIDSLAWPVLLAEVYIAQTNDRTMYTPALHRALQQIVYTFACEQHHARCSKYRYPYAVYTDGRYNDATGLIWSAFRPSDDAVQYRFNIPQNMMAVIALDDITELAVSGYGDVKLAARARTVLSSALQGITLYGRFYDERRRAWMYAYETDGYGRYNRMDDANIPNLTTLPYLNWTSAFDPTYLATRAFTLSRNDPWYFSGRYAAGLGSPHTPYGFVWPLGIIGRALTSTSSAEVSTSLTTLAETDSEAGMIHESFYPDGYWRFTRQEFGWANALYAELVFRSVAGFASTPFLYHGGTMTEFEDRSITPVLVPTIVQIDNASEILRALRQLLNAGRAAATN
ncbi:MAG: glycoside hydrolase family 125 protein [Candidatus Eremiobacteraeota bacterium]|nr:glycoside hydrolase family 125 protein [Candidatus Eremiobacteraeota bacterium]